ncbi:hypothetical protein [Armatimonas rosea]|uniref:Uncharacterized protein n=1 Tax=Armatimonas rosea TaxID=685828 RepID=A0A7W9SM68_ARMRO|nr:hypothetical protein [Armatimonas rosea]MBB6049190.1 hypothetical protein [Armatimonas rosea]
MKAPLEFLLAGYTIEKSTEVHLRDPKTGYVLVRSGDCDGALKHLRLFPSAEEMSRSTDAAWVSDLKFEAKPLPLETGRGISIGDRPEKIFREMGKPTWRGGSTYMPGDEVWSYHHRVGTPKQGVEYKALFRFRRGRVVAMELHSENYPS